MTESPSESTARGHRKAGSAHLETIAVETFSVVLGVLLALAANSWHDRRVHADDASEALSAIRTELQSNRTALQAKIPYHRAMRDSLAALVGRTKGSGVPGGQRAIANWSGLQPIQLLDDAWQSARATQAVQYLPYDVVIGLSRTYAAQQRIGEVNRAFFADVYTPAFATGGVSALAAMGSYLEDVTVTEEHLLRQYDDEMARLGGAAARAR